MSKAFRNTMAALSICGGMIAALEPIFKDNKEISLVIISVKEQFRYCVRNWPKIYNWSKEIHSVNEKFKQWESTYLKDKDRVRPVLLTSIVLGVLTEIEFKLNEPRKSWVNELVSRVAVLNDHCEMLTEEQDENEIVEHEEAYELSKTFKVFQEK